MGILEDLLDFIIGDDDESDDAEDESDDDDGLDVIDDAIDTMYEMCENSGQETLIGRCAEVFGSMGEAAVLSGDTGMVYEACATTLGNQGLDAVGEILDEGLAMLDDAAEDLQNAKTVASALF